MQMYKCSHGCLSPTHYSIRGTLRKKLQLFHQPEFEFPCTGSLLAPLETCLRCNLLIAKCQLGLAPGSRADGMIEILSLPLHIAQYWHDLPGQFDFIYSKVD